MRTLRCAPRRVAIRRRAVNTFVFGQRKGFLARPALKVGKCCRCPRILKTAARLEIDVIVSHRRNICIVRRVGRVRTPRIRVRRIGRRGKRLLKSLAAAFCLRVGFHQMIFFNNRRTTLISSRRRARAKRARAIKRFLKRVRPDPWGQFWPDG